MADRYSRLGAMPQIALLLLLIVGLVIGGLVWFDYLGIIDINDTFAPVLSLVGIAPRQGTGDPGDVMLLDRVRLEKQQQAVTLREAQLDQRRQELESSQQEIQEILHSLESREEELEDRENSLNERVRRYENRRAVLEENSRNLTNMPPERAVEILVSYDDQLLIDTLRVSEELAQEAGEASLVSFWLSQMPADRAAEIQRKMTIKPDE
ncbi:MAG: periplasmic-type flagellar collar protein FlbB [Alkalispirochaetaceae bacterium]